MQEEGQDKDSDEKPQEAEHHGKTSHAAENVEQSDTCTAQDQAGKSENDQKEVRILSIGNWILIKPAT